MEHQDCRHLLDDLSSYLDGEASAIVCAEIEQHLQECADCRVLVDTLRKTVYLYRSLPQPAMPHQLRSRLYKKLDLTEFMADTE